MTEEEKVDCEAILSRMTDWYEHRIACKMLIWGLSFDEAFEQLRLEIERDA